MARRPRARDEDWDFPRYPPSVPRPADGITARSQRGAIATTWWSQRFVAVLESFGLGTRMARGRRYARSGQVLRLEVLPGWVHARVQGSRRTPYVVTIGAPMLRPEEWVRVEAALARRAGYVARLLAGEMPPDIEEAFAETRTTLFPRRWADLRADCTCPDVANPCKHIAAVLYLLAERLDDDPFLVLAWRGRDREALLAALRAGRGTPAEGGAVAVVDAGLPPWWPFPGGALPVGAGDDLSEDLPPEPPVPPDAVLALLSPLARTVRGVPLADLVRPAYERMADAVAETVTPPAPHSRT